MAGSPSISRQATRRVWLSDLPTGYLFAGREPSIEDLVLPPDRPVTEREYRVRPGTNWSFQFVRGSDRRPFRGFVTTVMGLNVPSRAQADESGRARLTLPTKGHQAELAVRESDPLTSGEIQTGMLRMRLEWEPDFRPDELDEIARPDANERRFRLVDADARTAVLRAPDLVEPVKEDGKLVLRVTVPHRDARDYGALTGQVLDERGSPIPGARVAVGASGGIRGLADLRHWATADRQGHYRLRDIPRRAIDGAPLRVRLSVTSEGFAGTESPFLVLTESDPERPQLIEPIRLERGVSLRGQMVDHRGQPVAGALILTNQPFMRGGSGGIPITVQTVQNGRFVIDGVRRGVVQLFVLHGTFQKSFFYLADGSPAAVRIPLPDPAKEAAPNFAALAAPPPAPLAVGQTAPEWKVGAWSDGRPRRLADERGKVVVLYFWGISFGPAVDALPAMGRLMTRFQSRGVDFLAIHRPESDKGLAREQGRKVLTFQGAPLVMALDQARIPRHARGVTLQRYGGQGFPLPVIIVIDRAGKIAYRSDMAPGDRNPIRAYTQTARNAGGMTEPQFNEQVERTLAEEIAKALKTD